ncbi:MAG: AAA family ATPase, partial [Thermoanaerobaculia bacterium]
MRIERVRIEGFGALSGVDVAWPEGKLLLVVDPNETGKSTFCEAIVTALFGLPRGRVSASRAKERRRPRSGARLSVGLDLIAEGVRWSVDRDLDAGTFRVLDRDRGVERTKEFLRSGGRDVFGETVTGLSELLFRSTAYVAQNILDGDRLESALTLELARIADSGGGEASVVRALKALQDVRSKMPDAVSGPTVSVETEIVRLSRRVDERRAENARLADARRAVAEHMERLRLLDARREASRRGLVLAGVAQLETDRRALSTKLEELGHAQEIRASLEKEAVELEDTHLFSAEALHEIDRVREERGTRPELLLTARRSLEETTRAEQAEEADQLRRFGPTASLTEDSRRRLAEILADVVENAAESTTAAELLDAQWQELEREGLADDLKRLDPLGPEDRAFLAGAEEERRSLELDGIRFDRKAADAQAAAAIAVGERRERVKRARALVIVAALLLPLSIYLFLPSSHVPFGVAASLAVFDAALGLFGGIAWLRGARHRLADEAGKKEEEVASRREAALIRKKLSEHRLRLDRVSKTAG